MSDQLGFEHRFTAATVTRHFPNYIDVDLDRPLLGVRRARIQREHWGHGQHEWRTGQRLEQVFVYNLDIALKPERMGVPDAHAFASLAWGSAQNNPWNSSHPRRPLAGQVVGATVVRYAGPRDAVLRLDGTLLEAFLRLDEVPMGRHRPIMDLLPSGLKLLVKITEVDSLRCKLETSVQKLLADRESSQGSGVYQVGKAHEHTPYLRFVDAYADSVDEPPEGKTASSDAPAATVLSQRWQGHGVLIIDDDKAFRAELVAWLNQFGAQAWTCDNAQRAEELLARHGQSISHVMVDYMLGSKDAFLQVVRLLLRNHKGRHIAVISGMADHEVQQGVERLRQMKGAQTLSLPLLGKPFHIRTMDDWLRTGHAQSVDLSRYTPAQHWQSDTGPVAYDIAQRAAHWLKAVCAHEKAVAGLWVRCHEPGHDVLAHHGLGAATGDGLPQEVLTEVAAQLGQSVVADVEFTREAARAEPNAMGPLTPIWPKAAAHLLAVPLFELDRLPHGVGTAEAQRSVSDVLLLFSTKPISESNLREPAWEALHRWWHDLVELERAQGRLMEEAVFATQGRVHSATLHEIRPMLQALQSPKPWTAEQAVQWWPNGQRLSRLVEGGLYNIRPDRIARINLRQRLEDLMRDYLWQFAARRFVNLVVHLPPRGLVVNLPPEVLEQPLANLIDNATKSCQALRWARVTVRLRIDDTDSAHPLVLSVEDQGAGMTPAEERHLFRPRHTHGGPKGFGMGLYVSQRLARAAGGVLILADNRRWSGCTFELRLPLVMGGAAAAEKGVGN